MPEPSHEELKARIAELETQAAARKADGLEFRVDPDLPRVQVTRVVNVFAPSINPLDARGMGEITITGVAAVCGWLSYDPEINLVYYGTSNPGTWDPSQRPGDNRWATSIFARDPDTGYARWAYQQTLHDEWDFDGVNESILVSMTRPGS